MQDKSNIYPELKILSPLEQTWASYSRNPLAMAGLWCFMLLLLITLVGPLVVPYGIDEQHTDKLLLAPSWAATGNIDYFSAPMIWGATCFPGWWWGRASPLVMRWWWW